MKKISKQLSIVLMLTFLLGYWKEVQAQKTYYVQQELEEKFSENWNDIERVVFSKHRDDGHLVIAMHAIGCKDCNGQSPQIDIDFKRKYNKDYLFAYQFDCHQVILEDARAIFKNFKSDVRKVNSLDKNVDLVENIPMEHRYIFYHLVETADELIKICSYPQEL
ncbi:hypothetical protein MRY82_07530 [bacterium]|nr:hypothetical protein [bacterium]